MLFTVWTEETHRPTRDIDLNAVISPKQTVLIAVLLSATAFCHATDLNTDYITPPFTCSPDHRYAVMIPVYHWESAEEPDARVNKIAETGSGVVIGEIRCDPGYDRPLNFHEISRPRWSADSSLLLWKVNGKFSPDALVLLKIENNRIKWQLDLLKTAQQEILVRTRKAAPVAYAIAKTVNAANGSHYPEGFNIDVTTDSEDCRTVSLPLVVRADLSSNPKQIENLPTLTSNLDAVVRQDGGFVVRMFRLGER